MSKLFEVVKGMDVIVIINKTDLEQQIDLDQGERVSKRA